MEECNRSGYTEGLIVEIEFGSAEIEKLCLDDRAAQRKHGRKYADALSARYRQVSQAATAGDLLGQPGRWEVLRHAPLTMSGRITVKDRIVISILDVDHKDIAAGNRIRIVRVTGHYEDR